MPGPSSLAPKGDSGHSSFGWPPTVTKLEFSTNLGTSPLATKPLDSDPCSPRTHRAALWSGGRQSASTAYSSEEESSEEDDFEHIVHLSTPEAVDQPSLHGSPAAADQCGLPSATTQVSLSSSRCITAVRGRSWKAQSTRAFLNFSPDFSKGLSAFKPHHPNNELNGNSPILVAMLWS